MKQQKCKKWCRWWSKWLWKATAYAASYTGHYRYPDSITYKCSRCGAEFTIE